ncbi:MAG: hypothetical protein ACE5JK_05115 [Candidatus Omnitrophota bacterium]
MKIGMIGAWNTDSGASIHAELVGRQWVEKGIDLKVFTFYKHAFHGTALTKKEDEPYVTRCFAPYGFHHLPMNTTPLLEADFDIFVAQDLGMLPMAHIMNIFPEIRKKAKTVNVVHDGELSGKPEYFQFDWDHVVCFDDRYYGFLRDAYPEGILSIIPYPSYPLRLGNMEETRKELNLPMDKKVVLLFGQAAEHALNTALVLDRLVDRYNICLLLLTEVEKVLSEFRRIQNRVKFDFTVVERSPDQELLYKYLHASDCMIYNKHYAPVVVVGSTIYQCLGSKCPILARDTNYVYNFNREIIKHKLYYDLEENLVDVFEKGRRYQMQQRAVEDYLEDNAASPTADKFLELFEDLLKRER